MRRESQEANKTDRSVSIGRISHRSTAEVNTSGIINADNIKSFKISSNYE